MRVSVLIPSYNRLAFLREAVQSAREQTHSDLEILISDDGSTDGTREYVAELAKSDSRIRLLTGNPKRGIFSNMNYLVSNSAGDAFCVLGDDDRLRPKF